MAEFERLLVCGLGLLGGSAALAARREGLSAEVTIWGRRDLSEAVAAGLADRQVPSLREGAAEADFILLATPVDVIRRQLPEVLAAARPGALVTDVGSTKRLLVEAAGAGPPSRAHFVGSHPMAGSHRTGWEAATPDLFHGSTTYVTITEHTNTAAAARLCRFWEALGSRPVVTDPAHHDALCALLSHVPHLAASALVELIAQSGEDPEFLRTLAGSGFRDTTRVALGSGALWAEICSHNREEIASRLDCTAEILRSLAADVRSAPPEEIATRLDEAAALRGRLDRGE